MVLTTLVNEVDLNYISINYISIIRFDRKSYILLLRANVHMCYDIQTEVFYMEEKYLSIRVPEDFRQELRVYLAKRNISLRDYIVTLVTEDMQKHNKKEG